MFLRCDLYTLTSIPLYAKKSRVKAVESLQLTVIERLCRSKISLFGQNPITKRFLSQQLPERRNHVLQKSSSGNRFGLAAQFGYVNTHR